MVCNDPPASEWHVPPSVPSECKCSKQACRNKLKQVAARMPVIVLCSQMAYALKNPKTPQKVFFLLDGMPLKVPNCLLIVSPYSPILWAVCKKILARIEALESKLNSNELYKYGNYYTDNCKISL